MTVSGLALGNALVSEAQRFTVAGRLRCSATPAGQLAGQLSSD